MAAPGPSSTALAVLFMLAQCTYSYRVVNPFCHNCSTLCYIPREMVTSVASTSFAEWLALQMRTHGFDENQSKLATYLGVRSSTVSAWFNRGSTPSYATCIKLAGVLKLDESEVLSQAGYPVHMAEHRAPYDAPAWASLIPALTRGDAEYVGRLVESLAQNPIHRDEEPAQEGA